MEIFEITQVTDEVVEAFARLVPQLSTTAAVPGREELTKIAASEASILLAVRNPEDNRIVGSLTLVVFRIPTGVRAWIEDVIVDSDLRGRGIGKALTNAAIERARQEGARTVDLSSRPARVAANQLYQRVGFEQRNTNVYRYKLDK
jgi:ribosomal protein S18 acetylase RimI-like enzyme